MIYLLTYNHSNVYANVSVSTDNVDYYQIGVLNTSQAHLMNDTFHRQEFDLEGHSKQVIFMKLDFFGEGVINLVRIGVFKHSIHICLLILI